MTNLWAESYKEIRQPFFEIEDPYVVNEEKRNYSSKKEKESEDEDEDEKDNEKEGKDKPKKWWDDDGDGKGWEKGEVKKSNKKVAKEERDLHSKSGKNEKIDVKKGLKNFNNPYEACEKAHAIAILTEWDEFKTYDWQKIYDSMLKPAFIFDGRNLYELNQMQELGYTYFSIGRQTIN